MKYSLRTGFMTVAVASAAVTLVPALAASASVHHSGPAAVAPTIQVVANGLNTPRGITYDPGTHSMLVAEAGIGPVDAAKGHPCAAGEGGTILCLGKTGSVFSYSLTRHSGRRIITELPSIATTDGSVVLGLHDLSMFAGQLNGVFGLLGTPTTRAGLGLGGVALGQVAHLTSRDKAQPYGNIASYEIFKYGAGMESDPYGLQTGPYGTVVANAGGTPVPGSNYGGNDLLLVKPDGQIAELAAFPQRPVPGQPTVIDESVPTTVARGPDGAFYVGELGGFPYNVGFARVWRVVPGHAPTVFARGFTNIIDITFDPAGRLIVLEIAKHGLLSANQTGALYRINKDGTRTLLASTGLTNPGGVVALSNNVFYITNFSQSNGGTGQLLKVTVH